MNKILCFIPVIGTIHYICELYQLNQQFMKLAESVPSIIHLRPAHILSAELKNQEILGQLNKFPADVKFKFVDRYQEYASHKFQINDSALFGSVIQCIICLAAAVFHPGFFLIGGIAAMTAVVSWIKQSSRIQLYTRCNDTIYLAQY